MNPKPEGEGIIALRAHPKIRRGDPFRVSPSAQPGFHRVFSRIIPCFTRFHLESDRSVNRKTVMQKSAANSKLQLVSNYSSVISDTFNYKIRAL